MTNWYPTKDNPFVGCFFKEQAFATSEYFNYLVVRYTEHNKFTPLYWLMALFGKNYKLKEINTENNTVEYDLCVYYPRVYLKELWYKIIHRKHCKKEGIGFYNAFSYQKLKHDLLAKIFKKHFANKIDVVYCVDAQIESYNLQCVSDALKIPYIIGEHAPFPWPGKVIDEVNHNAIEKADLFLAISNDKIRQVLLQNIKLKKIAYIGNLIDETKFLPKASMLDKKTFIIVAAHSFYKNYDVFIAVMNRLTEISKTDFSVMIVGYSANKGYSKNVEEFENKIKNSKFYEKAVMVPYVSRENMPEIYQKASAFIMTSIQEGQPVSSLEAACCGLPIFSTRCGGVEDYVDDSVGRIYDLTDVESFANGLNDYLEGKISFDSDHIRKSIVDRYGRKAFIEKFAKLFNSVIENGHQG